MAIATLSEIKALLGIADTSQDARITLLIPIVQDEIVTYCNNTFTDSLGAEDWPVSLKLYAARMIAYQLSSMSDAGLSSESIGNYSYTRKDGGSADAGYPAEILRGLDRWANVKTGHAQVVIGFRERRGSTAGLATVDGSAINRLGE